ncbi:MAG: ABC transporter permease [Methylobacteriaceae bacterium]|nr:ABC transporter permease [Methylobacteriaceae bacterium]
MDFAFYTEVIVRLLGAVPTTLELAFVSVAIGAVMAVGLAMMRQSRIAALDMFARGFIFVFRGTPLLVQIFLIFYGLSQFPAIRQSWAWQYLREPYFCAILALALNTAAYTAEILRGGLQSVPFGQVEAARACGMSGFTLYRRIILPIAIRQALPSYGTEVILMVRSTALASIITLMELTGVAQKINSETFRAIEVFICAGAIYLAINFLLSRVIMALEYWLTPHLRAPKIAAAPATNGVAA